MRFDFEIAFTSHRDIVIVVIIMATKQAPVQIAILGAGTFVKNQYLPRLSEISNLFILKAIWSRTQESATSAVEIARKHFDGVECKWGDNGLDEIIQDPSIIAVAVVLAGQNQVNKFSYYATKFHSMYICLFSWIALYSCVSLTIAFLMIARLEQIN